MRWVSRRDQFAEGDVAVTNWRNDFTQGPIDHTGTEWGQPRSLRHAPETVATILARLMGPWDARMDSLRSSRALHADLATIHDRTGRTDNAAEARWKTGLYEQANAMLEYGPRPQLDWAERGAVEIAAGIKRAKDIAAKQRWAFYGASCAVDAADKRRQETGDEYAAYR